MKSALAYTLVFCGAIAVLYLRFSGHVRPREMTAIGRALLWLSAFLLSFGPLAILLFKLLWDTLGYDATPLSILIYVAAALCAAWLAAHIARWVAT